MERDILKLKKWCINKKFQGWKVANICAHAQIPRRTFYNWLNNYKTEGIRGLENKSRKPKIIHTTSQELINQVINIRKKHGWCSEMIEAYLKNNNIRIGYSTIYRIIKSNGLINYNLKRKQRTYIRWEKNTITASGKQI
ncbi:MAG: helix-turn-helix domain-containing protein [Candidatus Nanoarchaeia archaeon]|nr:helix-turn-helix domain-containing protein [Candidatus Nanoarchaeia archaeon]MDD5054503.1 helix-turn-helix domain-containing protein [Candidatus Nanoarchaeia archaeon]MDD5499972.1 helix-turn-helix domain-containing protein [Candidatus Nanoarchaeia archaeon]